MRCNFRIGTALIALLLLKAGGHADESVERAPLAPKRVDPKNETIDVSTDANLTRHEATPLTRRVASTFIDGEKEDGRNASARVDGNSSTSSRRDDVDLLSANGATLDDANETSTSTSGIPMQAKDGVDGGEEQRRQHATTVFLRTPRTETTTESAIPFNTTVTESNVNASVSSNDTFPFTSKASASVRSELNDSNNEPFTLPTFNASFTDIVPSEMNKTADSSTTALINVTENVIDNSPSAKSNISTDNETQLPNTSTTAISNRADEYANEMPSTMLKNRIFVSEHVLGKFRHPPTKVNVLGASVNERTGKTLVAGDEDDGTFDISAEAVGHSPHEFTVTIDDDWDAFSHDASRLTTLVRKLAAFFGDDDASKIHVRDVYRGSVVVKWSNVTVVDCSGANDLLSRMAASNGTLRAELRAALEPEFTVVELSAATACDAERASDGSVTVVVLCFVALLLLVVVAFVGCKLYRHQRDVVDITDSNAPMTESVFLRSHGPFLFATEVEIVQFVGLNGERRSARSTSQLSDGTSQAYHNPSFVSDAPQND